VCCCGPPSNEAHSARATTPHPSENMPICAWYSENMPICAPVSRIMVAPRVLPRVCAVSRRFVLWVELMSSLESAESGRDKSTDMACVACGPLAI
jgi:hypothetical protein